MEKPGCGITGSLMIFAKSARIARWYAFRIAIVKSAVLYVSRDENKAVDKLQRSAFVYTEKFNTRAFSEKLGPRKSRAEWFRLFADHV